MGKVKIEVDLEEIKKVISQLSENEKETLFFELNPAWGKALKRMEEEAIREDDEGKTVSLKDV